MATITVSIGRKVNTGPTVVHPEGELCLASWTDFADFVNAEVGKVAQVVFEGFGTGYWTNPETSETVCEESYTVVALCDKPLFSVGIHVFRARLAQLAVAYRQDCIAVTFGTTELVEATTTEPF